MPYKLWALLAILAPLGIFSDDCIESPVIAAATIEPPIESPQVVHVEVMQVLAPRLPTVPTDVRAIAKLIDSVSRAQGVDAALVHAVIETESSFDPKAVSAAGACGLMQLMPETAKRLGVRDIFDPADNIRGGVRPLKELPALFDGGLEL